MSGTEIKFITPPNNLRQKQKLAGVSGTLDGVWLDAAEKSMGNAKFEYLEAVGEDLARLQAAYDEALKEQADRPAKVQELYAIVQLVKGQGSSFGYPLISTVGAQLARFIEDCGDDLSDAQMEGVKVHVETLRLIMQQKMEGDGGPLGQKIVAGLGLVIKKIVGEAASASGAA
jgi:hypothetical protein